MAAAGVACCLLVVTCLIAALDLGLSIAEIAMGSLHLADCPAQSKIPIYLVVAGCTGIILSLSNIVKARKSRGASQSGEESEEGSGAKCANSLISLLSLFAFAWLICGTVWVFGTSPTFQLEASSNATKTVAGTVEAPDHTYGNATLPGSTYCLEPLYKFAMATVLVRYAVMALYVLILFCACCACCATILGIACCAKCLADKDEEAAGDAAQREQSVKMMQKS